LSNSTTDGKGYGVLGIIRSIIQMLRKTGNYRKDIALWNFTPNEWQAYTGENLSETEKRFVMFNRKSVMIGSKLHSWKGLRKKLEDVEETELYEKRALKLVYSYRVKNTDDNTAERQYHTVFIPVPDGASAEQVVMSLKEENHIH